MATIIGDDKPHEGNQHSPSSLAGSNVRYPLSRRTTASQHDKEKAVIVDVDSIEASQPINRLRYLLEISKRILLVLDLASRPLNAKELAYVIVGSGKPTSAEDVTECINTFLTSYVRKNRNLQYELQVLPKTIPTSNGALREDSSALVAQLKDYIFTSTREDTPAFFSFKKTNLEQTQISFNTEHIAYDFLRDVVETEGNNQKTPLLSQLQNARNVIRLLLASWVHYEKDLDGMRRERAHDARLDWGRMIRYLLRPFDE